MFCLETIVSPETKGGHQDPDTEHRITFRLFVCLAAIPYRPPYLSLSVVFEMPPLKLHHPCRMATREASTDGSAAVCGLCATTHSLSDPEHFTVQSQGHWNTSPTGLDNISAGMVPRGLVQALEGTQALSMLENQPLRFAVSICLSA